MPRLFWTALWFRKIQQSPVNTLGSLMTRLLYNSNTLSPKLSLDVSTTAQTLSALSASVYKRSLLPLSLNTFYMSGFNLFPWMKPLNKSCPSACTHTSTAKGKRSLVWEFGIILQTRPELRAHGVRIPPLGDVRTGQSCWKKGSEALPAWGLQPSWEREKGTNTQESLEWFESWPWCAEHRHWPHSWSTTPEYQHWPHSCSTTLKHHHWPHSCSSTDPTPAPPPCPSASLQPKNAIFPLMLLLGCSKNCYDRDHALCRVGLENLY